MSDQRKWLWESLLSGGQTCSFDTPMFSLVIEIKATGTAKAWNWRVRMRSRDGTFDTMVGCDSYRPTKYVALDEALEFVQRFKVSMKMVVEGIDAYRLDAYRGT